MKAKQWIKDYVDFAMPLIMVISIQLKYVDFFNVKCVALNLSII